MQGPGLVGEAAVAGADPVEEILARGRLRAVEVEDKGVAAQAGVDAPVPASPTTSNPSATSSARAEVRNSA